MAWSVVTEPVAEPVTLTEAKAHLRVDGTDNDTEIEGLITAARQWVETTCNRALMPQTWSMGLDYFEYGSVALTGGPFQSITSVEYFDTDGVEQTLASSEYIVSISEPAKIAPVDTWPSTQDRIDAVTITASVGYADADSVPSPIKSAIKLHVELLFDRPTGKDAEAIERARDALLFSYRDGATL